MNFSLPYYGSGVRGTGSADPTYLVRLLSDNHENVNELAGKYYPPAEFVDYKATKQRPMPMLYQSGYLTIKGYNARRNTYLLEYPNEEVRSGMTIQSDFPTAKSHFYLY